MQGCELILEALKEIPTSAGVYKMIGNKGFLYIGKAKNLKARLKSYTKFEDLTVKNKVMIKSVLKLEYEVVESEAEALILESSLIKKHQPPFNILLKDDKTKPYIVLSKNHAFPGISVKRGRPSKFEEYYGPFADKKAINDVLNIVCKAFKLRTCSDEKFKSAKRPCLEFQIKRCTAPCVSFVSKEDYEKDFFLASRFLSGKTSDILKELKEKMLAASELEKFEIAAIFRDKIFGIQKLLGDEKIDFRKFEDIDAISIMEKGGQVGIEVFAIRGGFSYGGSLFFPSKTDGETLEACLQFFIMRHYLDSEIPKQIVVNIPFEGLEATTIALSKLAGFSVKLSFASRGKLRELLDFITPNLTEKLEKKIGESEKTKENLSKLQALLSLSKPIQRVEIYDNSHINGAFMLGAMVVAGEGGFVKQEYRKFNAKFEDTKKGDDYGMLRETLRRRFLNEKLAQVKPDLIIIDGGKGQFSSALQVFEELGIDVPFICMAKGRDRNAGKEWFFYKTEEFQLDFKSPLLYYLQNLRDEAHRFAITSHRKRREKID
jgi:excinuclease ABC subunit C